MDRNVVVPDIALKWIQPSSKPRIDFSNAGVRQVVDFPGKMSDEEIMAVFRTVLYPKPKFRLADAMKEHLSRVIAGILLFAVSVIGVARLWRTRDQHQAQAAAI